MLPPVEHHDGAVAAQRPVEEEFGHRTQTLGRRRMPQLAARERVDEEPVLEQRYRLRDRTSELRIVQRHHVERAVQLDVMQPEAHGAAKSGEGTQLVEDVITAVGRSDVDPATPEAEKVGKARMGPYGDSALLGSLKRPPHHGRIAGMKAAGDVRRGHGSQHCLVGASLP